MDLNNMEIIPFILEIIIFIALMYLLRYIRGELNKRSYKILNPEEYFPEEEIHTLRQVFYLIMMGLLFIDILYLMLTIGSDVIYLAVFDIALSLYLAITIDKTSPKNKILLILLIPYGSLTYIIFGNTLVGIIDLIHVPVFIYFIKVYYDKFREYTESHGLGITILLLFTIIFISFLITQVAENVNPLDSLVMVSNAFTSNGYNIMGKSIPGKIDSIILVWGGYLLSGVGTATLASAILIRHYHSKIDEYDEKLDEVNRKLDEITDIVKNEKE